MTSCSGSCKWSVHVLLICLTIAESRTIKSKILTNENGTKELVLEKGSDVPRGEIDFLIRNLNHINITIATTTEANREEGNKTRLNEDILLKHWNTLTEFAPASTTEVPNAAFDQTEEPGDATTTTVKSKIGRRIWSHEVAEEQEEEEEKDVTEDTTEDAEVQEEGDVQGTNKVLDSFSLVFQCTKEHSIQDGLLRCIASRIRSLLYPMWRKFDETVDYYLNIFENCSGPGNNTNAERAYYHRQRRFLYHVVLPLLVVILVKYLVALPFLLFGMFAAKSLLFGLFSAGAASLHSIAKKYEYLYPRYPVKRYRHVQGVDLPATTPDGTLYWSQIPWTVPEDGRVYENINM